MLPVIFSFTVIIRKQQLRHEMREKMEKSLLQTIMIDEDKVVWIKPGKEIFVKGKMFDVKETEKKDSKIVFHGLYDEEETALMKNIDNSLKKQSTSLQNLLNNLFSLLLGVYTNQNEVNYSVDVLSTEKNSGINQIWSQPTLKILTPPPQAG
jgi:hypothetical protein